MNNKSINYLEYILDIASLLLGQQYTTNRDAKKFQIIPLISIHYKTYYRKLLLTQKLIHRKKDRIAVTSRLFTIKLPICNMPFTHKCHFVENIKHEAKL